MNKQEKLIAKAFNAPCSLTFDEFKTLLKRSGWKYKRCKGSHEMWIESTGKILVIQNNKGKAKGYQVKQFLEQYEEEPCHESNT